MIIKRPIKKKREKYCLKGAVQINHSSFFVYTDNSGRTFLKNGTDEKLQKSMVQNMIDLNPKIKGLLK